MQFGRPSSPHLRLSVLAVGLALAPLSACSDSADPSPDTCGPNGHAHDGHCDCDDGYVEVGGVCAKAPDTVDCGDHGYAHGDHCHCDDGYVEEHGTCIEEAPAGLDCGAHGHAHGDHCHCEDGYVEAHGTCVEDPA